MVVKNVGERSMPQIMAKTCDWYIKNILLWNFKWRLLLFKFMHQFSRNIACSNTMLESFVYSGWEYIVNEAKLIQISKSLKLFCVDDVPTNKWQNISLTIEALIQNNHEHYPCIFYFKVLDLFDFRLKLQSDLGYCYSAKGVLLEKRYLSLGTSWKD